MTEDVNHCNHILVYTGCKHNNSQLNVIFGNFHSLLHIYKHINFKRYLLLSLFNQMNVGLTSVIQSGY